EEQVAAVRARTDRPFGLNFFVHAPPAEDDATAAAIAAMRRRLATHREALGVDDVVAPVPPPFGAAMLDVVLRLRPAVVSFHFGLPDDDALAALRAAGIVILST